MELFFPYKKDCEMRTQYWGHAAAIFAVIVWGMTTVAIKVLLFQFSAFEILYFRFIIAYLALLIVYPIPIRPVSLTEELYFAVLGLCGITIFYLLQNISLIYTFASNVVIIFSSAPLFTILIAYFIFRTIKPNSSYFIGFIFAISGIIMMTYSNKVYFNLNPFGDFLMVVTTLAWALYSNLLNLWKLSNYNIGEL